jgi:hypothetical protein
MLRAIDAKLSRAKRKSVPVRIERRHFEGTKAWLDGYIGDFSAKLILIEVIGDNVRLDGCNILRKKDITALEVPNPRAEFYEKALRLQAERRGKHPALQLDNVRTALETVNAASPLVVIHRESIDPDVCEIGRILEFKTRSFVMQMMDLHAEFHEEIDTYDYTEITRIDFGGGYENALALVAGLTKSSSSTKSKRKQ